VRIEDVELLIHPCVENACMDARVSELRVVELLDGLCTKMKEYTLNSLGFGAEIWLKVQGGTPPVPELDMSNLFFLDPYLSRQFLK
jgi:hypothetical protein